jgi:hypothetical protein
VGPARRLGVAIDPFKGRQAIADTVFATTTALNTTHSATNTRVTRYDGSTAKLFALVEAQHLPKEDHNRHLLLKSIYWLELSRSDGGWWIDHMKIETVWLNGDPTVLFPSA